jgi:hypothetical protein
MQIREFNPISSAGIQIMEQLYQTITSMSPVNKGLYLESFFSIKMNLDDPIFPPSEDLFFHVDLRFGFLGGKGTNDYYAFVATPEAMKKHRSLLSGKKVIIVGENPIEDMLTSINLTIQQCTATDSLSAFSELSKFYEWEYENYRVTND